MAKKVMGIISLLTTITVLILIIYFLIKDRDLLSSEEFLYSIGGIFICTIVLYFLISTFTGKKYDEPDLSKIRHENKILKKMIEQELLKDNLRKQN